MGDGGDPELLYGVHPVLEALTHRRRSVERLLVARERQSGGVGRLLKLAREAGVAVSHVPRNVLERQLGRGVRHQGVVAVVAELPYADPDEILAHAAGLARAVVVALDGVQDPHNLGSIVRSASAAGAAGLLIGSGVGLTGAAVKVAAGAAESLPVARDPKLSRRLVEVRQAGFRCVALDSRDGEPWDGVDLTGRIILVAGAEGKGLRPGILDACQTRIQVPLAPGIDSLNVGVAMGVVLFEAVRQQRVRDRSPERKP